MSKKSMKIVSGVLIACILAGCSVGQKVDGNIRSATAEAGALAATAAQPMAAADISPVKVSDKPYVKAEAIRNENGDPLPSKFEKENGITIVKATPVGLAEIASEITAQTRIPVVLGTRSIMPQGNSSNAGSADASLPQLAQGPLPEGFPLGEALAQITSGGSGSTISPVVADVASGTMRADYSGPLSGLLDIVSSQFNVAWKYERGKIVIDTIVSRTFDVPALAMTSTLNFNLSSQSSSGQTESGSDTQAGQTATSTAESNVFGEVNDAVQNLIPEGYGTFSINKSAGTITVTSSPAVVDRVAEYLKTVNQKLSKQIALSVKVYSVTLNNDEQFDLDVQGIFTEAAKQGISIGTASAGGVVPPVGGAIGPGLGWALLDTSSEWNGSNALVQALSTQGDVSVVTTASVTTLSGVPVPFQVGEQRDFVNEVSVERDSESGTSTTSISTESLSTGFSLQINPRVERNGDVLVQYGINISELVGQEDGFDTFTAPDGSASVQLRRVSIRNFIQQARIPNKNTLVLAGFEQVRNEAKKRGVGRANFPLLGGGRQSSLRREIIVILITPTILNAS